MGRYVLRAVPVGIQATGMRQERDSTGRIDVPADRYWGALTQRALNACSGDGRTIPGRFFQSYGYVKRASTVVNGRAGRLPLWKTAAISGAAGDLIAGRLFDHFPLPVWHADSLQDADTNVNEVLANRASQLLGRVAGAGRPIDPAGDVGMGPRPRAGFTAAMCIATVMEIEEGVAPRCSALMRTIERAGSLSPGPVRRVRSALGRLDEAEGSLHELGAEPGDTPDQDPGDWPLMVGSIAVDTGRPFIVAAEPYSDRESIDAMVAAMAAVRGLAIVLLEVAAGLGRVWTSGAVASLDGAAGAMTEVCRTVLRQDQLVAAAAGQAGATVCLAQPLIATAVLTSLRRVGDACEAMRRVMARTR